MLCGQGCGHWGEWGGARPAVHPQTAGGGGEQRTSAWSTARLGSTLLWWWAQGMLRKVQGEQEKQSEQGCGEIAAASKGNETLGQRAILRLARSPLLPPRWAGAARSCSFWSCGY